MQGVFFQNKESKRKSSNIIYVFISIYLVLYFSTVKLSGMYSYNIEWYPYIIFDAESLGNLINSTSKYINLILLIFVNCLIYCIYIFSFMMLKKYKAKRGNL